MAKSAAQVIANTANSLSMKKYMTKKGWSKQDAMYAVTDFVTCGKKISFADFMDSYEVKPVTVQ